MQGTSCAGLGGLEISRRARWRSRRQAKWDVSAWAFYEGSPRRACPSTRVSGAVARGAAHSFDVNTARGSFETILVAAGVRIPTLSVLTWLCVSSYGDFLILPTIYRPRCIGSVQEVLMACR